MVRTVDYVTRRRAVLAATINKYIKEAEPVASEEIAREFDLSPATIRNIFADLERSGYLTHPYTSGGRIPTDKGYRYYVDFLVFQLELLDQEKDFITSEYKRRIDRLEDILEKTSEILSEVTHYTCIVSFVEDEDKFFYRGISRILDQPEFHDFNRTRSLIRFIEEKEQLLGLIGRDFKEKVKVYIGQELDNPEVKSCSLAVSRYSLKKKPAGKVAILGPVRMEYNHIIPTLEYISDVFSQALENI